MEREPVTSDLLDRLKATLKTDEDGAVSRLLSEVRPQEILACWHELDDPERRRSLALLPPEKGAELFANIVSEEQPDLLESLPTDAAQDLLRRLDPDDLVDVLQAVEARDPARVPAALALLDVEQRTIARALTRYEEDEAGGLMTPEFVSIRAAMTVREVLDYLRRAAPGAETIYYLYVVDEAGRLVGVLSMRDLIVASESTRIAAIMDPDVVYVTTETDQEQVARVMADYDFAGLPVVDDESRLVGVITVDDVLDVLEREATEDIHRLGAAPADIDYAHAGPWLLFRKRASWLVLLVVSATLTFNVVNHYDQLIAEVVILAAFIPWLIGTGGNVGAQVATLVVRALGTRELEVGDYLKVVAKESAIGLLLGLAFGLFVAGYVIVFRGEPLLALALGVSMVLIALTANLVGASLPFLFRRLGFDPALTSSPAIITVMDVVGLVIYFRVVIWILAPALNGSG